MGTVIAHDAADGDLGAQGGDRQRQLGNDLTDDVQGADGQAEVPVPVSLVVDQVDDAVDLCPGASEVPLGDLRQGHHGEVLSHPVSPS